MPPAHEESEIFSRFNHRLAPITRNTTRACAIKAAALATAASARCAVQPPVVNGRRWVNCGFGAANSDAACAEVITSQILGPLEMVAFVATAGSSSFATIGAKSTARMTSKLAKTFKSSKVKMIKDAGNSLKKSARKELDDMDPWDAADFYDKVDTLTRIQSETEAVQAAAELAAMVDTTESPAPSPRSRGTRAIRFPAAAESRFRHGSYISVDKCHLASAKYHIHATRSPSCFNARGRTRRARVSPRRRKSRRK